MIILTQERISFIFILLTISITIVSAQDSVAIEQFLKRTQFAPHSGEFAGYYKGRNGIPAVIRLDADSTYTSFNSPTDSTDRQTVRIKGHRLIRPLIAPESSSSTMKEFTDLTHPTEELFTFDRIDSIIYLVPKNGSDRFSIEWMPGYDSASSVTRAVGNVQYISPAYYKKIRDARAFDSLHRSLQQQIAERGERSSRLGIFKTAAFIITVGLILVWAVRRKQAD